MIDLNQLRNFIAVAETEHVGKAAQQLNMTQSPLSRQIQDLEARLGLQLFERIKKRLYLTPVGREFLIDAKALIQQAGRIEEKASAWASGQKGQLEIGYIEGALNCGILPDILRKFKQTEPEINIRLWAMRSSSQFQALVKNELDIAFTYTAPIPKCNFICTKIHQEKFLLTSPDTSPPPSFSTPETLPFIAMPESISPQGVSDLTNALNTINIIPDISYEIAEPTAILGLVSAGIGHAIVQESMKKFAPQNINFHKLPKDFPLNLKIYMVARNTPSPQIAKFLNAP